MLEIAKLVACNPKVSQNISASSLARFSYGRTILLDETDATFNAKDERAETLRGILNSGFESDGTYSRTGGPNNDKELEYPTFSPKMISGIGKLPDTVADRSIRITMVKKRKDQKLPRFRKKQLKQKYAALAKQIEIWSSDQATRDALTHAEPRLMEELEDRANDIWEAYFAVADMCSSEIAEMARAAAIKLSGKRDDNLQRNERLLADMAKIFKRKNVDRIGSKELVFELCNDTEMEWGGFNKGNGIDERYVSAQLKPFNIFSWQWKFEGNIGLKGYSLTETNPRQDGVILQDVLDAHVPDDYDEYETTETAKPVGIDDAYVDERNETETLSETNTSHDNQEVSGVSIVSHTSGKEGQLSW